MTGINTARARALSIVLAGFLGGCPTPPPPSNEYPRQLVGDWIRIYPTAGALDTLTLDSDGTVRGSVAALDSLGLRFTRRKVGGPLMPGGFCIGGEVQYLCQGFRLKVDTLALASQRHAIFVRAVRDRRRVAITPWAGPVRPTAAPRPGDSVRALPAF